MAEEKNIRLVGHDALEHLAQNGRPWTHLGVVAVYPEDELVEAMAADHARLESTERGRGVTDISAGFDRAFPEYRAEVHTKRRARQRIALALVGATMASTILFATGVL